MVYIVNAHIRYICVQYTLMTDSALLPIPEYEWHAAWFSGRVGVSAGLGVLPIGPPLKSLCGALVNAAIDMRVDMGGMGGQFALIDNNVLPLFNKNLRAVALDLECFKSTVLALVSRAPYIQSVDIAFCAFFADDALASLATCTHLHTLRLSYVDLLTDAALGPIVAGCTRLCTVGLDDFPRLTDAGVTVLAGGPSLRSIRLSNCPLLTDGAAQALAAREDAGPCTGLDTLEFSVNRNLTSVGVGALGACTGLHTLNLSGCRGLTGAGVAVVVAACPGLHTVDLRYMPRVAAAVKALANTSIHTVLLTQDGSGEETDLTPAVVGALAVMGTCPNLHTLDLGGVVGLEDASICAIAACCPALWSIVLSQDGNADPWLTDVGLTGISAGCPGLRQVWLSRCYGLTDAGVAALGACTHLQSLYLEGCSTLGDAAILPVVEACPSLHTLNFFGARLGPGTTDVITGRPEGDLTDAVAIAAASAPSIHTLDLGYSAAMTIGAFEALLGSTTLERLCMGGPSVERVDTVYADHVKGGGRVLGEATLYVMGLGVRSVLLRSDLSVRSIW